MIFVRKIYVLNVNVTYIMNRLVLILFIAQNFSARLVIDGP